MMPLCVQVLVLAVACSCLLLTSARMMQIDRETLISAAIQEVEMEFAEIQTVKLSKTQEKLHAFKKATSEALAQGNAYLKFESMVRLAEKKILKSQRQATMQTASALAESLASELLHKPGSLLSKEEVARIYEESGCRGTVPPPTNCDTPEKQLYRTPDGTCNNLANPVWGAANTPFRRLIRERYDDGVSRGRGFLQSQGSSLFPGVFSPPSPSPRVASVRIVKDEEVHDSEHSHMLMQWGQFLDHDLNAAPEYENCPEKCKIEDDLEGSCNPFPVPEEDYDVAVTLADSRKCHPFKRSLAACPTQGLPTNEVPARQQLNSITHFIDGSNVYGHSEAILDNELKDLSSDAGLLKSGDPASVGSQRPLLPDAQSGSFVICPEGSEPCFLAGDLRCNEQSALSVMHTLWLREHNRVAQIIKNNNPGYSSDKVFNTARAIVVAEMQKITYEDYLPILFGDSYSSLVPEYHGYDHAMIPSIPNSFAAAAYRFGHSQIQPTLERLGDNYQPIPAGPLPLVDAFFDTSHVRQYGTDPLLRGLVATQARLVDEFMNSILTSRLFADDAATPGMDLASLNIQRGRDHGLPTYMIWKQWAKQECGGIESEFRSYVTEVDLLKVYGNLDNVDLFVGGLAEEPLPNGVVGAVFACIFSKTFVGLRDGDRFFYDNPDVFSPEQREQLKRTSLSRIICDNTDIVQVQPNAFLATQSRGACSELTSVDLTPWNSNQPVILPDLCYIKVRSSRTSVYYSTSRRTGTSGYDFNQKILNVGSEACFPIKCPKNSGETIFAVGAWQNSNCAPDRSPGLPASLAELPGSTIVISESVYIAQLDASVFSQSGNGIYTSLASCESASQIGLDYNCDKRRVNAQSNIDADDFINEVLQILVSDEVEQIMMQEKASLEGNEVTQEILKKLNEISSDEETFKMITEKAEKQSDDSSLLSRLEKVMTELE